MDNGNHSTSWNHQGSPTASMSLCLNLLWLHDRRWRPLSTLPWRSCQTGVTRVRWGSQRFSSSVHKIANSTCLRMTWTFATRTSPGIWLPSSTEKLKYVWKPHYCRTEMIINAHNYHVFHICVLLDHKRASYVGLSVPSARPAVFYHQECGTISELQHLSDQNLEL